MLRNAQYDFPLDSESDLEEKEKEEKEEEERSGLWAPEVFSGSTNHSYESFARSQIQGSKDKAKKNQYIRLGSSTHLAQKSYIDLL